MEAKDIIWIGLDPGKDTGFAVYVSNRKTILSCGKCAFWDAIKLVGEHLKRARAGEIGLAVAIESPKGNNPVFTSRLTCATIINQIEKTGVISKADRLEIGKNYRIDLTTAQRIGMNKEDGELLISYCERYGIHVEKVVPRKTKLTHEQFTKATGYKGQSNQHGRDASMLVWNR